LKKNINKTTEKKKRNENEVLDTWALVDIGRGPARVEFGFGLVATGNFSPNKQFRKIKKTATKAS
jgi:hypothetical protein